MMMMNKILKYFFLLKKQRDQEMFAHRLYGHSNQATVIHKLEYQSTIHSFLVCNFKKKFLNNAHKQIND